MNIFKNLKKLHRYERMEKFMEAGKLLLASASPGEIVCLISETGHIADLFENIKKCRVMSVEFVGDNNARIRLLDLENGRRYIVGNNDLVEVVFS